MHFFNCLGDNGGNLEHLDIYNLLEEEMSKYKTLNHENIKWDKVYTYCLEILQKHSLDMKICNYFILSCLTLNSKQSFEAASKLFDVLADLLKNSPQNICKQDDSLPMQKKKLKNIITHFITELNRLNLDDFSLIAQLNNTFKTLSELLGCQFQMIQTKQKQDSKQERQPSQISVSDSQQAESLKPHTITLKTLQDEEYRMLFISLAFEILELNINNPNAYAMFAESMWGTIKVPPPNNQNITQIRYPDRNLVQVILQDKSSSMDQIKCFMSNLTLNPFWIDGVKMFCEFLDRQKHSNALNLLKTLTKDFLTRFKEIRHLKFMEGQPMCGEQVLSYFLNSNTNLKQKKATSKDNSRNISDILRDIDSKNYDNSPSSNVDTLMNMAEVFEEKNMKNNAKILYTQLKDLMDKTLIKDYLVDEYIQIKSKITKL